MELIGKVNLEQREKYEETEKLIEAEMENAAETIAKATYFNTLTNTESILKHFLGMSWPKLKNTRLISKSTMRWLRLFQSIRTEILAKNKFNK